MAGRGRKAAQRLTTKITVACVVANPRARGNPLGHVRRRTIEYFAERESSPVLVTNSANVVKYMNKGYKDMVRRTSVSRIGAVEVEIELPPHHPVPLNSRGFICWATIEWGPPRSRTSVNVYCEVVWIRCVFREYYYRWKLRREEAPMFTSSPSSLLEAALDVLEEAEEDELDDDEDYNPEDDEDEDTTSEDDD